MSIRLAQVFEYLDSHPPGCHQGSFESYLDIIHNAYVESCPIENEKIKSGISEIDSILQCLPNEHSTGLQSTIISLCHEYESLAFSHGLLVGMLLMTELNALP